MLAISKPVEGCPLQPPGAFCLPPNRLTLMQLTCPPAMYFFQTPPRGRHTMFCDLFQSPYCNFLAASDALLLVHNSPNIMPVFFPFIVYLQPLPLMDSIVDTGCDMHSLISRHLNITFSPVECPLQPSYPMIVYDSN